MNRKDQEIIIKVRSTKYGKKQTIIYIPWLDDNDKKQLLKVLKRKLGTGGFIENGRIILRGNMIVRVRKVLQQWLDGMKDQRI